MCLTRTTGKLLNLGSRVGVVQHEQIGSVADGPKHGVRTGTQGNTGQHALSGTYIHLVRVHIFAVLTRKKGGWMGPSQIGVNEHDCAEWNKEAIGTGAQS